MKSGVTHQSFDLIHAFIILHVCWSSKYLSVAGSLFSAGFLGLRTTDTLDWKILCCGEAALGIPSSTEQMPVAAPHPSGENKKLSQDIARC